MTNPEYIERFVRLCCLIMSGSLSFFGTLCVIINMNNEDDREVRASIFRTLVAVVLFIAFYVAPTHR